MMLEWILIMFRTAIIDIPDSHGKVKAWQCAVDVPKG